LNAIVRIISNIYDYLNTNAVNLPALNLQPLFVKRRSFSNIF